MKRLFLITAIIITIACWQCTKDDNRNLSLKESVQQSAGKINSALSAISGSKGYQLLSVTEDGTKSDDFGFRDSIDLKLIAGVYDFKPGIAKYHHLFFPFRLFERTGTDAGLIINLPEKLVFHPRYLHNCDRADSVLKNNFTIKATDYHFYYTWWNNTDYLLKAGFSLNSEDIGSLGISSSWKSGSAGKYSRNFTFPEGYSVINSGSAGDTARLVFALAQDKDTLLMESLMFTGGEFQKREKQYVLSIGDVDIKRTTGIDSVQVFFKGLLQKKAAAKIEDTDPANNASICYKRDILLTFDDGTTAKLSDLLAPSKDILKSLSKSLGEMYFSKYIVDYIAFSIYYDNH